MNDVFIDIKDVDRQRNDLIKLVANEAHKILGVRLTLYENNKRHVKEMMKHTVEWAEKVQTSAIDHRDTRQALNLTVMKKLEYPLISLTLTTK